MNVEIAERRQRVAELRRSGAALVFIAEEVGASVSTVHRDVQAVLFDLRERSVDQIQQWRAVKAERYRAMIELLDAAIADAAQSPERLAPLVNSWVRVDERESRLLGTDAPGRAPVDTHYKQPMSEEEARAILAEMGDMMELE